MVFERQPVIVVLTQRRNELFGMVLNLEANPHPENHMSEPWFLSIILRFSCPSLRIFGLDEYEIDWFASDRYEAASSFVFAFGLRSAVSFLPPWYLDSGTASRRVVLVRFTIP